MQIISPFLHDHKVNILLTLYTCVYCYKCHTVWMKMKIFSYNIHDTYACTSIHKVHLVYDFSYTMLYDNSSPA